MQILVILMVILALLPTSEEDALRLFDLSPLGALQVALLGVVAVWVSAELVSWFVLRTLRLHPARRGAVIKLYGRLRAIHLGLTISVYLATVFLCDWAHAVRHQWGLQTSILLDELLILAPFILSLVAGWFSFYRVERSFYETSGTAAAIPFWNRSAYILFHVRHHLGLVLAPILAFTGLNELALYLFPVLQQDERYHLAALGGLGLVILIITPWLLMLIWSARSLPQGPLRDRLIAAARRLRFRFTDILLWNTRGGVANAMVTGLLPFPRYVLLSDSLIQNLTPGEVEGVFGHEIGHIRHHHMPLYLGFFMLSLGFLTLSAVALSDLIRELVGKEVDLTGLMLFGEQALEHLPLGLVMLALAGAYIYLVFGFLSRRCERQADIHGCKMGSCDQPDCIGEHVEVALSPARGLPLCPGGIRTFISALEKVADLNGIRRDKPSWRHASIARRVEFLQQLLARPSEEPRIQRRLLLVKCALFAALALSVAGLWRYLETTPSSSEASGESTAHSEQAAERHAGSL
jgi:STE24 endopeptidase